MTTSEERQLGRAKNAVLSFLESRLIVPKIYLDADWGGHHVDVLAIERDGVGDVHAVLVCSCKYLEDGHLNYLHHIEQMNRLIDRFMAVPAQYKYIVAVGDYLGSSFGGFVVSQSIRLQKLKEVSLPDDIREKLFAPDGIGRIGFVTIEAQDDTDPQVTLQIKPERFRAKIAKLADDYVQQHEADWEIRA
jgi:hypothetical protein